MELDLPPALKPFQDQLLATRQPFIRVKSGSARSTSLWESKVGGQPYLPEGIPFPTAPDGRPLYFLAQLNFAEMPRLEPFPEHGIVQFYINDDDLYGMDFDDGENPDTFRVLFFQDVREDASALQSTFPENSEFDLLPHHPDESYPLSFDLDEEVVPATDYHFWQTFGAGFFRRFGDEEWDMQDAFNKAVHSQGHKVGGYAYFTQDDPRRPEDPMLLLFQLDSDEQMDLMWGDMGVGHFFIREKDLRALDFSRVLYDWDCL